MTLYLLAEDDSSGMLQHRTARSTPLRPDLLQDSLAMTASDTTMEPIDRLRALCLALPEATEKETWEAPTFRVRNRIFAMVQRDDDAIAIWCKAPEGSQAVLVGADPGRFFVPPYVGHKGWVGMRLQPAPDWAEVDALVRRSYGLVAPRTLAARLK